MKEQNKHKFISLKEAAKISGYSSDYIGQLIRSGKILGKQVYYNIAWMTTAKAVLEYKQKEKHKKAGETVKDRSSSFLRRLKQKILWEMKVLKLFARSFRYILPIVVILVLSFSALVFFVFSLEFGRSSPKAQQVAEEEISPKKSLGQLEQSFIY